MLRSDPKEAPGRASIQEQRKEPAGFGQILTWQELSPAPPQGNTWEAPGLAPGAPLALQLLDFRHIWITSRRSWKLPACFSCE